MSPRDLKVGVLLPLWNGSLNGETAGIARNRAFARHAEAAGLDSVWFTDHLYWEAYVDFRAVGLQLPEELKGVKGGQWECWTAAAAVAATTSRIHLGTLVCNTTFRNPALLARMVDNVTELSEGRLILGLGAGDFISEHQAYGFDFTRHVGRFEESLQILKPMLRGETVSLQGEFHRVEDAALLPKSAFRAPPLMIGTLKGKPRMSRLVAQHADMWNCMIAFGDSALETYRDAWAPILAACEKWDRDPVTLSQGATVAVDFTAGPFGPMPSAVPFRGSLSEIAARFAEYADAGAEHVSVIPHPWNEDGLDRLGEVLALLRA
ncbi:MAG: LLM class flavin-dependent oxidoreductase [Gammaproteobacteria bacterium]|nr:LLM class flavin-dependent oxidoreductase [Gammaproteobacteria bacterium]